MGNVLIFPHIFKCGGTSLLKQFSAANIKLFVDNDHPPHRTNKFFLEQCERRNRECQLLDFVNFDLVFGHLPVDRYKRDTYRYVTLLRDLLDRAISHFFYWKNLPSSNLLAVHRNPIIAGIKSGKVDFLTFIHQLKLGDFYSSFLCDKKPVKFVLVGFLDNYSLFTNKLSKLPNIDIRLDVRMRENKRGSVKSEDLEKARELLRPDYAIYQQLRNY